MQNEDGDYGVKVMYAKIYCNEFGLVNLVSN